MSLKCKSYVDGIREDSTFGSCELGWAYIVICFGTAMGLIATALAWTPVRWGDRDREQSYSI